MPNWRERREARKNKKKNQKKGALVTDSVDHRPNKIMNTGGDEKIINKVRVKTSYHISQSKIKDENALITDEVTSNKKGANNINLFNGLKRSIHKSKYKTNKPGGGFVRNRQKRGVSGTKR